MTFISTMLNTPVTHSCSDVDIKHNYEFLSSVEYNLARDEIPGPLNDILNNQTDDGKRYLLSTAHWAIAPFSQDARTSVVCYPDGTGERITYIPGLTDDSTHPAEGFTTKKLWKYTTLAQLTSSLYEFTFTPSVPSEPSQDLSKWKKDMRVYGLAIGMGYNIHGGDFEGEQKCHYPTLYICSPVIDHATGDVDYVVLGTTAPVIAKRMRHMTTVYVDEQKKESNEIYMYEVGGIWEYYEDDSLNNFNTYAPTLSWLKIKFNWVETDKWISGRKVTILVPEIVGGSTNILHVPQGDPHIPCYLKEGSSGMKYVTPMIRPHVCNGFFYGSKYPSDADIKYPRSYFFHPTKHTTVPEFCDFHAAWSWGFQVRKSGGVSRYKELVSLRGPLRGAIGFCEGSFPLPIPNHGCEIVGGLDSCCGIHLDGEENWFAGGLSGLLQQVNSLIDRPYLDATEMIAQQFSRVIPETCNEIKFMPNALHRDCLYSSVVELDDNLWIAPESLLEKDGVYKEKVPWTVLSYTQSTGELMVGDVIDTSCLGAEVYMGAPRYWCAQKIGDSYWVWSSRIPISGNQEPEITVHKLEWKTHKMHTPVCENTPGMLQYMPNTDSLLIP